MFQRWGFMMGEIWLLLLLAALVGLLAGWFIWGRRPPVPADTGEADRLRTALEACNAKGRDQTARITALEGDLSAAKSAASESAAKAERAAAASTAASASAAAVAAQTVPKAAAPAGQATTASPPPTKAKAASAAPAAAVTKAAASKATSVKAEAGKSSAGKSNGARADSGKADSGKAASAATEAAKPAASKAADKPKGLTGARGGKPDDLKLIKGVGPKLEALCNKLGFYHFDQIASWTAKEIAWVDDNLEGFKGRVTREDWVQQARDLMNGLPPRPGGEK